METKWTQTLRTGQRKATEQQANTDNGSQELFVEVERGTQVRNYYRQVLQ